MGNIKYSILMPYYRRDCLHNTLISFNTYYKDRTDYEVIIIEDFKNTKDIVEHNKLLDIIKKFRDYNIKIVHLNSNIETCYNGSAHYNQGAKSASGDILIITNPECVHVTDILGYLDEQTGSDYNVFACLSAIFNGNINDMQEFKYRPGIWYQHTRNNRQLHFCSAISKINYNKICGFDEFYADGIGYDDDDFLRTIKTNLIAIRSVDNYYVVHIEHNRDHLSCNYLCQRNLQYYIKKWNKHPHYRGR